MTRVKTHEGGSFVLGAEPNKLLGQATNPVINFCFVCSKELIRGDINFIRELIPRCTQNELRYTQNELGGTMRNSPPKILDENAYILG